jgi:hypothetical protein
MREEVRLLVSQDRLEPDCVDYDNWNGGQYTWRFDLVLPILAFRGLDAKDRETMTTRIRDAMRQVIEAFEAHSLAEVRIVMQVPKAHANWKADARAWAEGRGVTNQGRARSTNIAPFESDGLLFRSRPEICLYHALKACGVTGAPLPVFIRGGAEYRRFGCAVDARGGGEGTCSVASDKERQSAADARPRGRDGRSQSALGREEPRMVNPILTTSGTTQRNFR